MNYDSFKELTPVTYEKCGVKLLHSIGIEKGRMCFCIHWHDRMELLLVTSGLLEVRIGDETILVHPGEIAIVNPCELHSGFSIQNNTSYDTFMFDLQLFLNGLPTVKNLLQPLCNQTEKVSNFSDNKLLISSLNRIKKDLTNNNLSSLVLTGELYSLIGQLLSCCPVVKKLKCDTENKIYKILMYINKNYSTPLSSASLCSLFHYDQAYFCRLFKKNTGLTFSKYLCIVRLENAIQLLNQTDLGISRISDQCGFTSVTYFCNCFRKQYGVNPSQFRSTLVLS